MKKILPILILGSAAGLMLIVLLNANTYRNYTDNFDEEDFNVKATFALDSESIIEEPREPQIEITYQNVEEEPERIQAFLKDFQEKEGFVSILDFQHVGNLISFSAFFNPGGGVYLLMEHGEEIELIYRGQEPPACSLLAENGVNPADYSELGNGAFDRNRECFAANITGSYRYFSYAKYIELYKGDLIETIENIIESNKKYVYFDSDIPTQRLYWLTDEGYPISFDTDKGINVIMTGITNDICTTNESVFKNLVNDIGSILVTNGFIRSELNKHLIDADEYNNLYASVGSVEYSLEGGTIDSTGYYNHEKDAIVFVEYTDSCQKADKNYTQRQANLYVFYGVESQISEQLPYVKVLGSNDRNSDTFRSVQLIEKTDTHGLFWTGTTKSLVTFTDGLWTVRANMHDTPRCSLVDPYDFPVSMIDKCVIETSDGWQEIIRKTEEMQKLKEFSFGSEIGANMNYDEPAEEISWLINTGEVTQKMGINYAFGRTDYNEIKADNCTLTNWSTSKNRLTQNNTEVLNVISSFEQYLKEVGYTKSTQNSTSSLVQNMANHGSIDYTNTVSYEDADNIVSLTHTSRCVDITKEGSSEWIKASDEILSVSVGKKN